MTAEGSPLPTSDENVRQRGGGVALSPAPRHLRPSAHRGRGRPESPSPRRRRSPPRPRQPQEPSGVPPQRLASSDAVARNRRACHSRRSRGVLEVSNLQFATPFRQPAAPPPPPVHGKALPVAERPPVLPPAGALKPTALLPRLRLPPRGRRRPPRARKPYCRHPRPMLGYRQAEPVTLIHPGWRVSPASAS